ncbi:putative LRR receptor-like serine/threonine-protein kinase [Panicum miliaceum]|uniref:non-specific serine/threonine protein kinase n=1 Tax=Panicum miliaceum TaxID=4540 RepID=A0A3L6T7I4_PANMI|nr:putative LRR receptor-like serine/threonine-protein kinase [Panicum miliaceum]
MRRGYRSSSGVLVWLVLVCSCFEAPRVQAQQAARTDPVEAAALNTILGRWGWKATRSPAWNISGEPCSGAAVDGTQLDGHIKFNPGITCDCSFNSNTVCHITMLNLDQNYLTGPIPSFIGQFSGMQHLSLGFNPFSGPLPKELGNLTNLNVLGISLDNFSGGLPEELGNLSKLEPLYIDSSGFSGPFPSTFSKLKKLKILRASDNDFTGRIPDYFGSLTNLEDLDFSYNRLTGRFPSWATESDLHLIPPSGLNCLQQDTPCFLGSPQYYSFAVDCGSNRSMTGSDNTIYDVDPTDLGASSYYVTGQTRWGVSNVGKFNQAPNGSTIIYSSNQQFQNTADSTVPNSKDVSIVTEGSLREKNFNIRKTAGGKSFTAVRKSYIATVSKNFLEIHLFWAGKGTCCIPKQGYYGPMISALSVAPNFTPTVQNGVPKKKSKAGEITGIVIGASVLGLAVLLGIDVFTKRRRLARQQEELYDVIGQPDVFSYAELKLATDNFSPQNILGEGGYGPVYKGTLTDGRAIAVKQLSESSHQGKRQFVAEVATISAVQHRNLVKLHGCCIDSNTHLLVYEYLENGSLDRALFGDSRLKLDWSTRFEIILGIARGLAYLHEESSIRIVHRDIKASNVLLDADLTPKVSDFGLAKLYNENKSHVSTTRIAGTFGYLAPEYAMRAQLTEKADVFAFGVVALEAVSGRSNTSYSLEERNIYLLERAWDLYEGEQPLRILDPRLEELFDAGEALRVIPLAAPAAADVEGGAMLTGKAEVAEEVAKPSYVVVTESELRGGDSGCSTSGYWGWSTSTPELSRQKEVDPLTQSPTITGDSHEIEGR